MLFKKQLRNKIPRVFLEIYGGKARKAISEDFKFRYYHKITKLVKKRILPDTMVLVTTPQEQQASRLNTEGLSEGLHVPLIIEICDSPPFSINKSNSFFLIFVTKSRRLRKHV